MADKKGLAITEEIPPGVEVKVERAVATVKGPKGEVTKKFIAPNVVVEVKDNNVSISSKKNTKREKKLIFTLRAHIKNMLGGVIEMHKYELKICSGHFPMKIDVKGTNLTINNFLGEKFPRKLKLKEGVIVKIEGEKINVESVDKELAGQTAADIEQLTRRPNFDPRIFQDGIYIINKDGKAIK